MDPMILWGISLIAGALVVVLFEAFLPSAGLLSILAAGLAIAGIVCLFRHDEMWGLGGTLAVIVLAPAAFAFVLRVWPHTPLGRRIIGTPSEDEQAAAKLAEDTARGARMSLIGKEGTAMTDLRPVGTAVIDGKRIEVLSETTFVPAGTKVRVSAADMSQIKVRPIG